MASWRWITVALISTLPLAGGCDSHSMNMRRESRIALSKAGVVIEGDYALVSVEAPLGMGVEHPVAVTSELTTDLKALAVTSTCGCASALLSHTNIEPGGTIILTFRFDPEDTAIDRKIVALLRHKDAPHRPFVIPIRHSATPALGDWRISASKREVVIDDLWSANYSKRWRIPLQIGSKVASNLLTASTTSSFIHAVVREEPTTQRPLLELLVKSPPIGKVNEEVLVRVQAGARSYYETVRVVGELLSPFYCEPSSVEK